MVASRRGSTAIVGWFLFALLLCTCQSGCVQRRMTVRTNPPGALLYVDDYPIGVTPVSADFTYYGTRKIRLVKDGFETKTVMQSIPAPWYQFPPMDFVAENFVPGQIRDQRVLDFKLEPQAVVPTEQLLSRAEGLRRGIHTVAGAAPSAAPSAGGVRNPAAITPSPYYPPALPPPAGTEVIPTPAGVGGQPVHPLPGGR